MCEETTVLTWFYRRDSHGSKTSQPPSRKSSTDSNERYLIYSAVETRRNLLIRNGGTFGRLIIDSKRRRLATCNFIIQPISNHHLTRPGNPWAKHFILLSYFRQDLKPEPAAYQARLPTLTAILATLVTFWPWQHSDFKVDINYIFQLNRCLSGFCFPLMWANV